VSREIVDGLGACVGLASRGLGRVSARG